MSATTPPTPPPDADAAAVALAVQSAVASASVVEKECSDNILAERQAEEDAQLDGGLQREPVPIYAEHGRGQKKRLELQKKLQKKLEDKGLGEKTATPEELAALAADAAEKITLANAPKVEDEKAKVKVGGKMMMTTEGGLAGVSSAEAMRIQSVAGAGKAGKVKAFVGTVDEKKEIGEEDVAADEVIMFSGCKQCEYTISATCVKVFVERCEDFVLRINGKIITQTLEIDNSEKINVLNYTKIGTLQVEQCKKVNIMFAAKDLFCGYMIWAGSFMLQLKVADDVIRCDFGLTQSVDKTIHIERTQFKVWYNQQKKLVCDKIIRLKNGFPTTKREDDEHMRREEQKLDALSKRMGVTVARKADSIGGRTKPNEPCPCGSGKKFKKCCKDGMVAAEVQKAKDADAPHAGIAQGHTEPTACGV